MSADKFTPGPWRVYQSPGFPDNYPYVVTDVVGNSICDASPGNPDITWAAATANARLIAAAPEMIEALHDFVAAWDSYEHLPSSPADAMLVARANAEFAIAKAAG